MSVPLSGPPRFTVITVCFNAAATIAATAQSLARQRFSSYEWLVVDGASSDLTLQVVDRLPVPNKHVVSAPDKGIYDAMNKAVALARGDWLYFLNSGDAFEDADVLADVSAAIDKQRGIQLLWGDMVYVAQSGQWPRRFSHVNRSNLIFADLNHQATFARRELFTSVGKFNLDFPTSADYDWLIRVLRSGARTHYLRRAISRFAVGGAHSANPQALSAERWRLRRQYMPPMRLRLGLFLARIGRRFRLIIGHGG